MTTCSHLSRSRYSSLFNLDFVSDLMAVAFQMCDSAHFQVRQSVLVSIGDIQL